MKKVMPIFLIVIYALATMGFSINQFYCCGKLSSTSITLLEKPKKGCEKNGCCENKSHFVKVKDNHVSTAEVDIPSKNLLDFHSLIPSFHILAFVNQKPVAIANRSNAPPILANVVIYLLNCVFRI